MGQILHGSAKTTHAVRAPIRRTLQSQSGYGDDEVEDARAPGGLQQRELPLHRRVASRESGAAPGKLTSSETANRPRPSRRASDFL